MEISGLKVSIDVSGAKRGEQQFNQSLDSMAARARTVSQQLGDAMKPGEKGFDSLAAEVRKMSTIKAQNALTQKFIDDEITRALTRAGLAPDHQIRGELQADAVLIGLRKAEVKIVDVRNTTLEALRSISLDECIAEMLQGVHADAEK